MRLMAIILTAMLTMGCASSTPHNPMRTERTNEPYWQQNTATVTSLSTSAVVNENRKLKAQLDLAEAKLEKTLEALGQLNASQQREIARLRIVQRKLLLAIKSLRAQLNQKAY